MKPKNLIFLILTITISVTGFLTFLLWNAFYAEEYGYLYAVDINTGKEKWITETEYAMDKPLIISDDIIYLKSAKSIIGIDSKSGKEEVKVTIPDHILYSPIISNKTVYCLCRTNKEEYFLYAIDIKTNKVKWLHPINEAWYRPSSAIYNNMLCFVTSDMEEARIYLLDLENGQLKWEKVTQNSQTPFVAISNNAIYYAGQNSLHKYDIQSGDEIWKHALKKSHSFAAKPIIEKDVIFFGIYGQLFKMKNQKLISSKESSYIYALETSTGAEKWTFKTQGGLVSSPTLTDKFIFAGDTSGYLYGINTTTGQLEWELHTDNSINASPLLLDNVLYFITGSFYDDVFTLKAVNLETKEEKWEVKGNGNVYSSPIISKGVVYFGGGFRPDTM